MSASINKVIIIGNCGKDPEVKTISNGSLVATFSIATSSSYIAKDGQKKDNTEWHRIVVWGKLAEVCQKYLTKGKQLYIEGKLQTRSWESETKGKQYTTEIVAHSVQFIGKAEKASDTTKDHLDFSNEQPPSFDASEELPF